MAGNPLKLTEVHFVKYRKKDGRLRWYVYAWRGGPKIMDGAGERKPALTPDAVAAYHKAHEDRRLPPANTFASLVVAYLDSPEFGGLADATKKDYRRWTDKAVEQFGDASLRLFGDRRMRGEILKWRDKWAYAPRQSHYAIQVLSRVLAWGVQRGLLLHNPAASMPSLYKADRADIVWTDDEIEAVAAKMQPHVARAFRLAALTGLARGDLVALRWDQVSDLYIERARNKTGVVQIIPLFDETRALLAEFPKSAVTVVTNQWGKPFTARGFSMAVERARDKAKVAEGKTLHDIRGTFGTLLMRRGFEDREIDEIMGWETGKSSRIRRSYISRRAVVIAAVERFKAGK